MVKVYRVNLNYLVLGEGGMFLGERELPLTERLKTGNPDVDVFLHYFFKNDIVKFNALLAFSKSLSEKYFFLKIILYQLFWVIFCAIIQHDRGKNRKKDTFYDTV